MVLSPVCFAFTRVFNEYMLSMCFVLKVKDIMLNVKVILGSTRQGRFSEKLVPWLKEAASKKEGLTVEVLDLRDYPMPFYDQAITPSQVANGDYANSIVKEWAKKIKEADAFLVVSPEYNHGYSAVLKNSLDSVYAEWNGKPIAFVSYGNMGGARAVEQLRQVVVELQMSPIRSAVHIQTPWFMLDEKGNLKPGSLDNFGKPLDVLFDQLIRVGEKLKA